MVDVEVEGATVDVARARRLARGAQRARADAQARRQHGRRASSKGFTRVLEINGVGYRAEAQGQRAPARARLLASDRLPAAAGRARRRSRSRRWSRSRAPTARCSGETAAAIRELRPPEPYKGKGIKYAEETIRRKAGKAAGAAS